MTVVVLVVVVVVVTVVGVVTVRTDPVTVVVGCVTVTLEPFDWVVVTVRVWPFPCEVTVLVLMPAATETMKATANPAMNATTPMIQGVAPPPVNLCPQFGQKLLPGGTGLPQLGQIRSGVPGSLS